MRGDVFRSGTLGKVFEVLAPAVGVGGVVEGDEDGVTADTDVAFLASHLALAVAGEALAGH